MRLEGKCALVTGAARGLGRAYALRLAALGADVAVVDIDLNAAAEFNETLSAPTVPDEIRAMGRKSIGIRGDLTKRADVERIFAEAIAAFGPIDVLVNNAGGALTPIERSAASVAPDDARRIPLRRLGTTDDCANVLEFLATDLSSYVTGQCISVCGGSVLSPS